MGIESLLGKPEEVEIDGVKIEIHPLTLDDLPLVMSLAIPEKHTSAIQDVILKTLRMSFPGESEENLKKVSMTHFKSLTEAIMKVNKLEPKKLEQTGQ